ncbi:hypothetical protein AHMF7616_01278 [Adhaeribacter pallidiroseus]|uniref:Uncharacterized protein n=1 Tax=Adhaeribacter pallidiroseus TaxID=2072847 RepID=A0A369QDA9_9BACT|nr:hypothetical protein AHMF7616_01278 [Adhaeribacter pallidiroseus]
MKAPLSTGEGPGVGLYLQPSNFLTLQPVTCNLKPESKHGSTGNH